MHDLTSLAAISWDPEIRGVLAVLVGVVVLCGSVYLLLATNTGARLGMLLALSSLFGWMTIMGVIWWIYGIGLVGASPHWQVQELNFGDVDQAATDPVRSLPMPDELPSVDEVLQRNPDLAREFEGEPPPESLSELVAADPSLQQRLDLGGWKLLDPSDPSRGEAQAAADAVLGPDGENIFADTSSYVVLDAYRRGGKPAPASESLIDRMLNKIRTSVMLRHPPHYAVVQVQAAEPQETTPGQAPPTPVPDEDAPVMSVVMVRDLGDKRFPPAMVTLFSGILFAVSVNVLHRRDKMAAAARAAAARS